MTIPTEGSGKGDTPRRVNRYHYGSNYDEIDWGSTKIPKRRRKSGWEKMVGKITKLVTGGME